MLGHLREVSDPFRTALAARLLPEASRVRVIHIGAALSPEMRAQAEAEARDNPRYEWLGEVPHDAARQWLARCRLMVLTSKLEGGANAIAESIVAGTPVISSRIDGSVGMLGAEYPGYFPVGDERALAELLMRAESDAAVLGRLEAECARSRQKFLRESEQEALASVFVKLAIL